MTKPAKPVAVASVLLILAFSAAAQTLSGSVTNGTTNKPAGDAIELINIANGMDVAANAKADSAGKFRFTLSGPPGPHLIRATHQGVTYFQFAPPGTSNVELKVYDVAKKVNGVSLTADVVRLQADKTSLEGMRVFAVDNNSSPPVTQMSDRSFEFYLPAGAKIEQLQAKAPNGQPIPADAVPEAEKGRYAISFPLRPGETEFQLEFTMPYNGSAKIDLKPLYPAQHFVVMLPKTMTFTPSDAAAFKSMQDPTQADSAVQVAQQTRVGQQLAFTVSGTGIVSEQQEQAGGQPGAGAQGGPMNENPQSESNRPGGGLGVPIDAPGPLEKYQWPILGAFAVLLALGGWVVTKRQGAVAVAGAGSAADRVARASGPLAAPITGPGASAISGAASQARTNASAASAPDAAAAATSATLPANVTATKPPAILEALKEELFHLEVERKQGKISEAEYEKAKAALDQTLERALKRQA